MKVIAEMMLLATLVGAQPKTAQPLSVCAVLAKLSSYQGQRVTVRGQLVGTDEGSFLIGEDCRPIVSDGYTWPAPTPVALTYPGSPGSQASRLPGTLPRVERVDPEALRSAGSGAKVYATVTGRLETRVHFEMVRRGDGKVVPYGYGHQAACIAQIVYDEVKDLAVVPPTPGKRDRPYLR